MSTYSYRVDLPGAPTPRSKGSPIAAYVKYTREGCSVCACVESGDVNRLDESDFCNLTWDQLEEGDAHDLIRRTAWTLVYSLQRKYGE